MSNDDVFIISSARTAIGSLGGSLKDIPVQTLGNIAVSAALERVLLQGDVVDEVYLGCVLQSGVGQAPARQAAIGAGIPISVPSTTVNKVCGSGLQSVILAARALKLKEIDVAVAGGMENMSRVPYALPNAREGYRLGHATLVDLMVQDGLWDVYNDLHMGTCADRVAQDENISRDEQDDFAARSYRRAQQAQANGSTSAEISPVAIPTKEGAPVIFDQDEGPHIFDEQKMRALKPAFEKEGGTITAGNASSINDGAAAVVLAGERAVKTMSLTPFARIVSWGFSARAPERFVTAPAIAVNNALAAAELGVEDIDFFEINEAFAVVPILAMREFALPLEKVNPLGGAISMGHPIGASGARILVTLLNVLNINQARYGLATLCIGGGEGIALIIERL